MQVNYYGDNGAMFTCANTSPPIPDILLTEADGLYGYENTIYTAEQNGQDGSSYVSSRLSTRRIGLTMKLTRDVVNIRNQIMQAISPKSIGRIRLIRGELVRDIRCMVEKISVNTSDASILTLYFLCPNPYWREQSESNVSIATWNALFAYPLTIEQGVGFMFGERTEERVINVQNNGTVPVGMRVVFNARSTVTNPKILNAMDQNQFMQATLTMQEGDILTVQTGSGEKKATLYRANGGVYSNAFPLLNIATITFLQLAVGDNYLQYKADSGESSLVVAVFYYLSYLEV